jgi:hypothetical protein
MNALNVDQFKLVSNFSRSHSTSGGSCIFTRNTNNLFINTTKTVAMSFCLCRSKPSYKPCILLRNTEIDYKSEVKFLGLCVTEDLTWQAHISSLCHSLSKSFYIIKVL